MVILWSILIGVYAMLLPFQIIQGNAGWAAFNAAMLVFAIVMVMSHA